MDEFNLKTFYKNKREYLILKLVNYAKDLLRSVIRSFRTGLLKRDYRNAVIIAELHLSNLPGYLNYRTGKPGIRQRVEVGVDVGWSCTGVILLRIMMIWTIWPGVANGATMPNPNFYRDGIHAGRKSDRSGFEPDM